MHARERLAFALDEPTLDRALRLLDLVAPEVGVVKVGLELYVREGPAAVRAVRERGCRVFLDLKLHDIPRTVAAAVGAAVELDIELLTVHAAGGAKMLDEAARAALGRCRLLAVTALTSLDAVDVASIGVAEPPAAWAERLGALALGHGCAGLVCSPHEVAALRRRHPTALLVSPGIRTDGGGHDDQARVATPEAAIAAGSDLLVVGRPIRDASDPAAAARAILARIEKHDPSKK